MFILTPLQGLAEYPGAPINEIRNATRRAFEKVLDAAISENVDFLIIAGDLYDTGLKSFESALFFNRQMARLADAGIALRLAAIEHHVETVSPCPVILDDILINADNSRASATLKVLSNLAGRTQVLFFTHHRHLEELGREAGAQIVDLNVATNRSPSATGHSYRNV